MHRTLLSLFVLLICHTANVNAQPGWTWQELPNMPEGVANNAVTQGFCGDTLCVYSFSGIDESLAPSGIHLKSWRYNTVSQLWTQLPDVPDVQGKIAAGASTINNLIYVVGGYYVSEDFDEWSSDDVHVFDPESNQWLDDAMPIPVAIDDQVQAVWNDSLLFVVTGWSDFQNVNNVQIYDPAFNTWQEGTPISNFNNWKAFGASGTFVNDTLFYLGGVNGGSFAATDFFRKGIVNSDDPSNIEWSLLEDFPGSDGYRMACASWYDRVFWIGGSTVSYNFDALAYNGSGVVNPSLRIATYYSNFGLWEDQQGAPPVMDLRGIAQVTTSSWIICGGIEEDQNVSNKAWLLSYDPSVNVGVIPQTSFQAYFANDMLVINTDKSMSSWKLYNASGLQVENGDAPKKLLPQLHSGIYVVEVLFKDGQRSAKRLPFIK